ncbi:MAG: hypothetical protein RMK99_13640 [Anaerolineales bacterium]|nr:hypothetical protein [Anaerolineales bacterium]
MTQCWVTTEAELVADIEHAWDAVKDADLHKPCRHYLPDEPGAGDRPAINVVYGNTAHHFAQNLGWIQALVAAPPG